MTDDDYFARVAAHLRVALSAAVPLWAWELQRVPADELLRRAPELAQVIAEKGDVIQFKSEKKGETAKAFNALAQALAILSFFPGGVRFLGDRYEARHPEFERFPDELLALLASLPVDRSGSAAVVQAHEELRAALASNNTLRIRAAAEAYREAALREVRR